MKNKTVERLEELTNCFLERNPNVIENLKDKLAGVYVDHLRREDKKNPEKFSHEVYEALNTYLQKEIYGIDAPKKATDMEQIVMRREMESYHNLQVKTLEEIFSENPMNVQTFNEMIKSIARNVVQKLNSETFNKVAKLAMEEPSGFKEYLSDLAKKQEIRIGENWFKTVEMQLRAYSELLHFMMQARK